MNKKLIKMSLIGSSSSLGTNWIYDKNLMKEFSKDKDLLFLPIQHELYEKAKAGFDVYPTFEVGDVDFMGEVIYRFHKYLEEGSEGSLKQYLYDSFGPSSSYNGYIEHYGKEIIEKINDGNEYTELVDKQLIGPAMFAIGFAHGLSNDEIIEFTKTLTAYSNIPQFFEVLRFIFEFAKPNNKEETLRKAATFLPKEYRESVEASFNEIDVDKFIDNFSGVACGMDQSIPLIFYILNNTKSFKEALQLNANLSGASCARGIIIGAIYSFVEDVPIEFKDILNYDI